MLAPLPVRMPPKRVQGPRRPRRVLISTDVLSGAFSFALELSQGLSRLGIDVVLATLGGRPSRAARAEARRVNGLELCESTFKLEWMQDAAGDFERTGQWLLQLEARFAPDLVQLHLPASAAFAWRAPVVVCLQKPPTSSDPLYLSRVANGFLNSALLVVPTRALLRGLEKTFVALPTTRVIPVGRSIGLPASAAKEPFVFACRRAWDAAKNLHVLDAAAQGLPWPVMAAGDVAPGFTPQKLAALGRLSPRTVGEWMARASIFASPSHDEGFSLSALEAAYAGCPLVLGDSESAHEVWGQDALYVDGADVTAVQRVLIELMNNPRDRRDLGQRAFARAQLFSGCRMLAAFRQAYVDLLTPELRGQALAPMATAQNMDKQTLDVGPVANAL